MNASNGHASGMFTNDDVMGTWHVNVVFWDGHGWTSGAPDVIKQDLTVTVQNTLHFTSADNTYWQEDSSTALNYQVTTDDDSSARGVTYSLGSDVPAWLAPHLHMDSNGHMWTDAGFSADNNLVGSYTFTIHGEDGHGGANQLFTLNIPNRDPVFDAPQSGGYDPGNPGNSGPFNTYDYYLKEDGGVQTVALHMDDAITGSTYHYTWSGAPQWMSLDPLTGIITVNPTNKDVGDWTVTVKAYDGQAGKDFGYTGGVDSDGSIDGVTTQTVTIHVLNRAPVFSSADHTSVNEDSPLSFNVQNDDESDGGTTYSWSAAKPSWVHIDTVTGLMTANPDNSDVGAFSFDIYANDTHGGVTTQHFALTVNDTAPKFLNPPASGYTWTLTEDAAAVQFQLLAEDQGEHNTNAGTVVYYHLDPATTPPGVRFADDHSGLWTMGAGEDQYGFLNSVTGLLILSPTNRDVVSSSSGITFPITIFDGNGMSDTINFTLKTQNTDPVFTSDTAIIWYEDQLTNLAGTTTVIPFNVDTTDENYDRFSGPGVSYSLIGAPSWLDIDAKDGHLTVHPLSTANDDPAFNSDPTIKGSPDNSMVGVYTFTIDFFDGTDHIQQSFSLTVNNRPTQITTSPADQLITQDTTLHITDAQIQATDEYSKNPYLYTQDYYTLEIKLNDQGNWIMVNDGTGNGTYNTLAATWSSAPYTSTRRPGKLRGRRRIPMCPTWWIPLEQKTLSAGFCTICSELRITTETPSTPPHIIP